MSKPKLFKLRAFVIENNNIHQNESDVYDKIVEKLNNSLAKDRRMLLNADDPSKEEDLICDYDISSENYINGAMLRIAPSNDVVNIPDDLFNEQKIVLNDLDRLEINNEIIYKDHYYFMFNNKFLITTLQGNTTITRFQTYINWLLQDLRGSNLYEFTPKVTFQPNLKMYDIKSMKVTDPAINQNIDETDESNVYTKLKNIPLQILKDFVTDVRSLDDVVLSEIISAELLIKFSKPKKMSKEDYQRSMGAFMKPIADTDNIALYPKKGRPIVGRDILKIKEVSIETTDSGRISENQLTQEMEKFLKELVNESTN